MRTLSSVRREYDRLRLRYYMDAAEPLRVPPPASDPALRWTWVQAPGLWAATHFDADGDPHLLELPYGQGSRVTRLVLLHELSHMRNPEANCHTWGRRWWRAEGRRLEALGAFSVEVF